MTDNQEIERVRKQLKLGEGVEGLWNDYTVQTLLNILDKRTEFLQELLRTRGCYHSGGVEIAEEISAEFDIGLELAHRIRETLQ